MAILGVNVILIWRALADDREAWSALEKQFAPYCPNCVGSQCGADGTQRSRGALKPILLLLLVSAA